MKPRFDTNHFNATPPSRREKPYRPSARDLMADSGLSRGELTLYGLLVVAIGFALAQNAQVTHSFVAKLPEFASVVAELVRGLV